MTIKSDKWIRKMAKEKNKHLKNVMKHSATLSGKLSAKTPALNIFPWSGY